MDHSPPSSTEIKNNWILPLLYVLIVWTGTFVHLIYGRTYINISKLTTVLHDFLSREKDNTVIPRLTSDPANELFG